MSYRYHLTPILHGLSRAAIAKVRGQSAKAAFFSGFASSGFSVGTTGYGGFVGRTTIMSLIGGTASAIAGGDFKNGAMTGAFVHMFNAEGGASSLVSGIGKVWNAANTAIGLVYGGIGHVVGLAMGTNPSINIGHNAIQFINNPFGGVGAITLGNTITYGTRMTHNDIEGYYGNHEEQHTYQGEVLGPLYLPAHITSIATGLVMDSDVHGPHAFMERGPSDRRNTRPW